MVLAILNVDAGTYPASHLAGSLQSSLPSRVSNNAIAPVTCSSANRRTAAGRAAEVTSGAACAEPTGALVVLGASAVDAVFGGATASAQPVESTSTARA